MLCLRMSSFVNFDFYFNYYFGKIKSYILQNIAITNYYVQLVDIS